MTERPAFNRRTAVVVGLLAAASILTGGGPLLASPSRVWIVKSIPHHASPLDHKTIAVKAKLHTRKRIESQALTLTTAARATVSVRTRDKIGAALQEKGLTVYHNDAQHPPTDLVLSVATGIKKVAYDSRRPAYDAEVQGQRFRFVIDTPPPGRDGKYTLFLHYVHAELIDRSAKPGRRLRWDGLAVLGDVLTQETRWSSSQLASIVDVLAEKVSGRFATDYQAVEVMDAGYQSGSELVAKVWDHQPLEALLTACESLNEQGENALQFRHGPPAKTLYRRHARSSDGQIVVFYYPAPVVSFWQRAVPIVEIPGNRNPFTGSELGGLIGIGPIVLSNPDQERVVARFWVDNEGIISRSWVEEGDADPCLLQYEFEDSQ